MDVWGSHVCMVPHRGQKPSDAPRMELQAVVNHHVEIKSKSSAEARNSPNH